MANTYIDTNALPHTKTPKWSWTFDRGEDGEMVTAFGPAEGDRSS